MIISVNYQDTGGAQFAMMTYCTFTKDGQNEINGVHVSKQVILINGLPFEIKSIYGMTNANVGEEANNLAEGQLANEDDSN